LLANGFNPQGAVRLQEKMLKLPAGLKVPFLSTHPSGEERIENLQKLVEVKKSDLNAKQQQTMNPQP
jgi:predicted Zn-dependent protease